MRSIGLGALLTLVLATTSSATTLDADRFHCVAHNATSGNFLMRSNMPLRLAINNATQRQEIAAADAFAYDELAALAAQRAVAECGAAAGALEGGFELIEVSLADALDDQNGLLAVRAWHADPAHFSLGRLAEWPLGVAGIVPAARVDPSKRTAVAEHMFGVDQLPTRVAMLDRLLAAPAAAAGLPVVVVVHCNAGCDRTGEMIGAWRLHRDHEGVAADRTRSGGGGGGGGASATSAAAMYAADIAECGRAPNYYSTHALEWYCLRLQAEGRGGLGDCLGFAKCEPFGDCEPVESASD